MILRKAMEQDAQRIWAILQDAIAQRKIEGSEQWQNGYPNLQVVLADIAAGDAFVLQGDGDIIACATVIVGPDPAYAEISGQWLSNGPYVAVHRVARDKHVARAGIATTLMQQIELLCHQRAIPSIRLDTNFDNVAMLRITEKLGYTYCGEITFQGASRMAFEKLLVGTA